MNKVWIFFVLCVLLYICANAWNDPWVGQQGLRVIMIALVMFLGLWLWKCLGVKGNDEDVK